MANNFTLLLKKEFIDNRKPMLIGLVGILATYILSGILFGLMEGFGIVAELVAFSFITSMVVTIVASLTFSNMKTKEGRINTLMIPATSFQKFIIRWIATVPLMLIVVGVSCFLGDFARLIVERMNHYSNPDYDTISKVFQKFYNEEWGLLGSITIMSLMVSQSIYFLGSILWPKLSFIKTMAVMQVLQLLFTIGLMAIDFNIILEPIKLLHNLSTASYIGGTVVSLALYVAAYWRFRNSEVVYKLF